MARPLSTLFPRVEHEQVQASKATAKEREQALAPFLQFRRPRRRRMGGICMTLVLVKMESLSVNVPLGNRVSLSLAAWLGLCEQVVDALSCDVLRR